MFDKKSWNQMCEGPKPTSAVTENREGGSGSVVMGGADVAADMQDFVTDQIRSGSYRWCRAKLFTALVQARKQGVLEEVLNEIFDDTSVIVQTVAEDEIIKALDRWK